MWYLGDPRFSLSASSLKWLASILRISLDKVEVTLTPVLSRNGTPIASHRSEVNKGNGKEVYAAYLP